MRIAIISDIHSNLTALMTALEAIDEQKVDEIYCLGDIVGYGAEPGPCVDLVRTHCTAAVRGNHDEAVALEMGIPVLPKNGQIAAVHNRAELTGSQIDYLANLPYKMKANDCTFVHSTPGNPELWMHVESYKIMQDQFQYFDTDVCFVGHTHVPGVQASKLGVFRVRPGARFIINVGSVGQPRDGDNRLAFGVFDTEEIKYESIRKEYDFRWAGSKIMEAGLPKQLADRLATAE